jgi:heme/copper-type cytochrome/quinol oxidase subunit 3
MVRLKHWQDAVNAVLGAWLVLSPWAIGYAGETVAMANAIVVGLAMIAAALGAIFVPRAWEEWTEAVLGLWLMVSPWALGFSALRGARLTAVATGVVIAVLALWTVITDKDYSAWWRNRAAH